ncbi:MAG TPA: DUF1592 domain-containing protein [Polyangia bacterium]|nr:DUF1592 domain-containing protein [Polyangia bacterium]
MRRLLLAALVAAGCTGTVGGPGGGGGLSTGGGKPAGGGSGTVTAGGGKTDPGAAPPSAQVACPSATQETVGARVLRRLTNAELETTIRAVFGLSATQWPGVTLPPDTGSIDGFTNNVDNLTVSAAYAGGSLDGGKAVAAAVSADPMLGKLLPCAANAQGDAACADTFIKTYGAKLYRRPLTAAEIARYQALYAKVTKQGDFHSFVYWATTAMLQSPNVIYRSELGQSAGGGRYQLTPYEVASQLSYAFTGGPPSDSLLQQAAANQLGTADQLEAAARALAFGSATGTAPTPGFRAVILQFFNQWLQLGGLSNLKKDAQLFPTYSADVQDAMAGETNQFLSAAVFDDRGTVKSVLTAPYTYVNSALAGYYGFGTAAGDAFVRATRPAEWGVGVLAQGSILSVQANSLSTSPTRRGHLVRTRLLCGVVPPPPPVVKPISPPTMANTTRQRYESLHSADPTCKACHSTMDEIGFALEHLDGAGRYRAMEGAFPIDDSGVISGTSAGDVKVAGATDLANALTRLPEVNDCVASFTSAYVFGVDHQDAACLGSSAAAELRAGASLVDFYIRLARAEHFRFRQ